MFNQNVHLHRGLAQVLQEEFKKHEERQLQLEEKMDVLEKNLKEGFLHYTREIIKGLDVTTQALLDTISPPFDQIVNFEFGLSELSCASTGEHAERSASRSRCLTSQDFVFH